MIEQADLDVALRAVPSDVCFAASALAGHVIRLSEDNPALEEVELPSVCERCLLDAVPLAVWQALGREVRIAWVSPEEFFGGEGLPNGFLTGGSIEKESVEKETVPTEKGSGLVEEGPGPARIGVVGNALLCFDPFMNDHIVDFINGQGCKAVLPDPRLLATDDVRYFEQFDRFAEQGVRHVIYLQSFGCLKGHVRARGALHELARRYPDMPVTVIDYDPEASALNRENRIRLALAAARQVDREAAHEGASRD